MWGKPEDGKAAATRRKTTRWSEIAPRLAPDGVPPGASISMADAALVPDDTLAARRDPGCIPRWPATDRAGGRGMAAAGAANRWEEGGVLAQPPPTKHRPGPFEKVAEG